jgi:hypothetical protein
MKIYQVCIQRLVGCHLRLVGTGQMFGRITEGAELTPVSTAAMLGLIAVLSIYYWASHGKETHREPDHEDVAGRISSAGRADG